MAFGATACNALASLIYVNGNGENLKFRLSLAVEDERLKKSL